MQFHFQVASMTVMGASASIDQAEMTVRRPPPKMASSPKEAPAWPISMKVV